LTSSLASDSGSESDLDSDSELDSEESLSFLSFELDLALHPPRQWYSARNIGFDLVLNFAGIFRLEVVQSRINGRARTSFGLSHGWPKN